LHRYFFTHSDDIITTRPIFNTDFEETTIDIRTDNFEEVRSLCGEMIRRILIQARTTTIFSVNIRNVVLFANELFSSFCDYYGLIDAPVELQAFIVNTVQPALCPGLLRMLRLMGRSRLRTLSMRVDNNETFNDGFFLSLLDIHSLTYFDSTYAGSFSIDIETLRVIVTKFRAFHFVDAILPISPESLRLIVVDFFDARRAERVTVQFRFPSPLTSDDIADKIFHGFAHTKIIPGKFYAVTTPNGRCDLELTQQAHLYSLDMTLKPLYWN